MAYSKFYQSGNENVAIGFFRNNKVAIPTGSVKLLRNMGAIVQPVVELEALNDTGIGKKDNRDPVVTGYNAGSSQLIK